MTTATSWVCGNRWLQLAGRGSARRPESINRWCLVVMVMGVAEPWTSERCRLLSPSPAPAASAWAAMNARVPWSGDAVLDSTICKQ